MSACRYIFLCRHIMRIHAIHAEEQNDINTLLVIIWKKQNINTNYIFSWIKTYQNSSNIRYLISEKYDIKYAGNTSEKSQIPKYIEKKSRKTSHRRTFRSYRKVLLAADPIRSDSIASSPPHVHSCVCSSVRVWIIRVCSSQSTYTYSIIRLYTIHVIVCEHSRFSYKMWFFFFLKSRSPAHSVFNLKAYNARILSSFHVYFETLIKLRFYENDYYSFCSIRFRVIFEVFSSFLSGNLHLMLKLFKFKFSHYTGFET